MSFGDTSDDVSSEQEANPQKGKTSGVSVSKFEPENLTKTPKVSHKCPQCEAVFTRPYRLKNHIASQHLSLKPFKCNHSGCNKTYTNSSHLQRHKITAHSRENDNSKGVICGVEDCGSIFANKYNLKKHILRKHQHPKFKCLLCNEIFHRKSQLNTHKVEIHNLEAPYKCIECDRVFVQLHSYHKHKSAHRTYKCDCEKSFKRWSEYLKHKRTECALKKTEHECAICNKIFVLKQNLTQHVLNVHVQDSNDEHYKCAYVDCNRSYKYKRNLQFHTKTVHEKQFEYFKCTFGNCDIVLKSKRNLKNHLRIVHNDTTLKEKKRRKPRKDIGVRRGFMDVASTLTGIKIAHTENQHNIKGLSVVIKKLENEEPIKDDYNKVHMSKVLSILNYKGDEASKLNKINEDGSKVSSIPNNSSEDLLEVVVINTETSEDVCIKASSPELGTINKDESQELLKPNDCSKEVGSKINTKIPQYVPSNRDELDTINEEFLQFNDHSKDVQYVINIQSSPIQQSQSLDELKNKKTSLMDMDLAKVDEALIVNGSIALNFPEINKEKAIL